MRCFVYYTSVLSVIVREPSVGTNVSIQVLLPEAVCCCLQMYGNDGVGSAPSL